MNATTILVPAVALTVVLFVYCEALLTRFQQTGLRFALASADTGATVGIATIEDVVAELVGEIDDPS